MNYYIVILLIIILLLVLLLGIVLHILVRLKRERDALSQELSLQSFARTELIKKQIDLSMLQEQINPTFYIILLRLSAARQSWQTRQRSPMPRKLLETISDTVSTVMANPSTFSRNCRTYRIITRLSGSVFLTG